MLAKCFLLYNPELRAHVSLIITNNVSLNTIWLYLITSLEYRMRLSLPVFLVPRGGPSKYKLNTYIHKRKTGERRNREKPLLRKMTELV